MTKHYHFIGIGGIGMSGLAKLLLHQKIPVSGSDKSSSYITDKLQKEGAIIHQGHSENHIQPGMTVVYHSDIPKTNPELVAAQTLQCPILHRADLLGKLLEGHQTLAVTGTHGKTTTSSLLASVLLTANIDPSFAIGGTLVEQQTNAYFGNGQWFVFEADESDRAFLKYSPTGAIVTNIDNDHLNYYEGRQDVLIAAFNQFMDQVVNPDYLFWCGDDPHLRRLNHPGKSYGLESQCDWMASNLRQRGFSIVFDIEGDGHIYRDVEVALTGLHNALNACAIFGLARTLGIKEEAIRQAFKGFKGVMRRCEKKGKQHGVLFLDDYAHHPTEIKSTLRAIRSAIKERRLIAVFQPHRHSRTRDCLGLYGTIFDTADELFMTETFAAGESSIPGISHKNIIEEIESASTIPIHEVSRADLSQVLADFVQPHDVVVTLGAGDVTKAGPETLAILEKQPPKTLKIGLVFGGAGDDLDASLRSLQYFKDCLSPHYYNVEEFGLTSFDLPEEMRHQWQECDVLMPALHGSYGESGYIQGFFEMMGKAYTGCDYQACAIAMDKVLCKMLAQQQGIRISPYIAFSSDEWHLNGEAIKQTIQQTLRLPVFVKPNHLNATIGIQKIYEFEQLDQAIREALRYDTHILVENGINGREIQYAVLGNHDIVVFPPGEILTNGRVYDYEAKSTGINNPGITSRADLPHYLVEEGKKLSEQLYRACRCSGFARIDFFLDNKGTFWFNEINPVLKFSAHSLFPQICAYNGLSGHDLMNQLIILALHRKRRQLRASKAPV